MVVFAIALVILLFIFVVAIARSISKFIHDIPAYMNQAKKPNDKVVKTALGIVLIPVFYGMAKLFKINTDWLLNLLQNQDFLVIPFLVLLYFILAMLFVEILYGLISGEDRKTWLKKLTTMVSTTGDSVIGICDGLIKSFLRLLKLIPDFLKSIEMILLGDDEEDKACNAPSEKSNANDQENDGK